MPTPLQVTFRGLQSSPAMMEAIRSKHEKLAALCDRIGSCHVVVEAPHHHQRHGGTFGVHITLAVAGADVSAGHTIGPSDPSHQDVHVALRDAFDDARRRVQAAIGKRRVSNRPPAP